MTKLGRDAYGRWRWTMGTAHALAASGCLALAACGGGAAPAASPHDHEQGAHGHEQGAHAHDHGGHEHEHGGDEHGHGGHSALPPGPIHDLHEVIRPLWHADKTPDREKKTCAATADMKKHASAIEAGPMPEAARADEGAWKKDAAALTASIAALEAECAKAEGSRAEFEVRFSAVHDAFHAVTARAGAKH